MKKEPKRIQFKLLYRIFVMGPWKKARVFEILLGGALGSEHYWIMYRESILCWMGERRGWGSILGYDMHGGAWNSFLYGRICLVYALLRKNCSLLTYVVSFEFLIESNKDCFYLRKNKIFFYQSFFFLEKGFTMLITNVCL